MWYVYHLDLEGGRHYVGSTRTLEQRDAEHAAGCGSAWTRAYPPVGPVAVVEVVGSKEEATRKETAVAKLLMGEYGIANVRGGAFCTMELTMWQVAVLEMELAHDRGECFRCGSTEHFAGECVTKRSEVCFRCGREGHWQAGCTETTHVNGSQLGTRRRVAQAT